MAKHKRMDPAEDQEWLDEQESRIVQYLASEGLEVDGDPEIEWCVAPIVALWHTRCAGRSVWVISGDLPTDFLVDQSSIGGARQAMRAFCSRWQQVSECMLQGKQHPSIVIGSLLEAGELTELGDLLKRRATILQKWVDDNVSWVEGTA
jgi:hypothetical protein